MEKIFKTKSIYALKNLSFLDYVRNKKPVIAIYAGSFNPFHKGHKNVMEKAEKIFDKVIIAVGDNKSKSVEGFSNVKTLDYLKYKQIDFYKGLLSDYLKTKPYDVTLIRGLRSSFDFQHELNQHRFLQTLMPEIKIVNIFCDSEFEHISSSSIKQLISYGGDHYKQFMVS